MFPISNAGEWQERDAQRGRGSVRFAWRLLSSLIGLKAKAGDDDSADELALFPSQ